MYKEAIPAQWQQTDLHTIETTWENRHLRIHASFRWRGNIIHLRLSHAPNGSGFEHETLMEVNGIWYKGRAGRFKWCSKVHEELPVLVIGKRILQIRMSQLTMTLKDKRIAARDMNERQLVELPKRGRAWSGSPFEILPSSKSALKRLLFSDEIHALRIERDGPDYQRPMCWEPSDGLSLFHAENKHSMEDQLVRTEESYPEKHCIGLIVDRWELGRSSYSEDEHETKVASAEFIALAASLGIETIAPLHLMMKICERFQGPLAYEQFKAHLKERGIEHSSMSRRD